MKSIKLLSTVAVAFSLLASPLWAQDEEVTIEVVDDSQSEPEEVISEIRLPESASDEARENAAHGLDTANRAREKRREFGQERASEAREQRGIGRGNGGEAPERGNPPERGSPDVNPGRP